ncbi:MAG: hypothetical protein J7483_10985 [Novosphingobium sp.]|nr:hypothetical protein [Novosphingobium sp.]
MSWIPQTTLIVLAAFACAFVAAELLARHVARRRARARIDTGFLAAPHDEF